MTIAAAGSGAPYTEAHRKPYHLKLNRSCALADQVYPDKRASDDPRVFRQRWTAYLEEMIPQHFERRIQFFFEQAICCYQTGLAFTMSKALTQGLSPDRIMMEGESVQRNAAHSNTLPCLLTKDGTRRYIFLKDTQAYALWNATMNMPRYVNNADIRIDGNRAPKLRAQALALLNRTAQADLTPDEALAAFLAHCKQQIDDALPHARGKEEITLRKYQTVCVKHQETLQKHPHRLINPLLGIFIGAHDPAAATLRGIRYQSIRKLHLEEFKILQKIDHLRKQLLGSQEQPYDFERVFLTLLVASVAKTEQSTLKQFLHFNPEELGSLDTRGEKTKELLAPHAVKIAQAAERAVQDLKRWNAATIEARGDTLRCIRRARNLTQAELAKRVREVSDDAWPQSKISRAERGELILDEKSVKHFAEALDVDPRLFEIA